MKRLSHSFRRPATPRCYDAALKQDPIRWQDAVGAIAALYLTANATLDERRKVRNRVAQRFRDAADRGEIGSVAIGHGGKGFRHSAFCRWALSAFPEVPGLAGFVYPTLIAQSAVTLGGVTGVGSGITSFPDDIEWLRANYRRVSEERQSLIKQRDHLRSELSDCQADKEKLLAKASARSKTNSANGRKNPGPPKRK